MVEIKNYLSYDGLKLYDELIKKYIATADEAVLNQILGELDPTDAKTIKDLNDLIAAAAGTAGTALQKITVGTDGQFVTTTVSEKGEGTTQSVAVSVKTATLDGTEDGLVTANDARTALNGKVDKVEGSRLMTDAEGKKLEAIEKGAQVNVIESINVNGVDATITGKKATVTIPEATTSKSGVMSALDKSKLDGIAEGAQVNYVKSVGDNLAVDADGKLTVDIPAATVTGVDTTVVDGLKLELADKKVKLVDDGLAKTLEGKDVIVRKKEGTLDDQYVYEILQGEKVVGTINHPKDMVVTAGEVIVASTEEGLESGKKYLKLTIANQETPVYIAVTDLVDVYTEGAGITISDTNEVSVKLAETQGDVVLDTTNGLKASLEGWTTVKNDSHTHSNKAELDKIADGDVAKWDAKQDAMEAITNAEIEALFAEVTSL